MLPLLRVSKIGHKQKVAFPNSQHVALLRRIAALLAPGSMPGSAASIQESHLSVLM
jgi:hypothetical protein